MKKIILNASLITCALLLVFGITSCKKEVKSYTVTFMDGETVLKTETVKEGSSATGLTPTKEGHDFVGCLLMNIVDMSNHLFKVCVCYVK